jgi:hypothetical protein
MMRSPRRTAAAMPKRSAPLPSIDCRMASTLTGALPSIFPSGKPAELNVSNLGASLMFYSGGKTGLELRERRISFSDCQVVKQ